MYVPWFRIDGLTIDLSTDIKYLTTLDAAELTVKSIMRDFPPPYRIMVSGGIDSQTMLYAWKLFGKDYIPTSIEYSNGFNDHDLITLKAFAQQESIEIEYVNFDILDFFKDRFFYIVEKYHCCSPQFAAHIGMSEPLDGTCVFSGDRLDENVCHITSKNICMLEAAQDRPIVPYFFMHTPEISYSLLYEHGNLTTGIEQETFYDYERKVLSYTKSGIPVIAQPTKYTGFEKVREYYDNNFAHLRTPKLKLTYFKQYPRHCMFDLLLRYPYQKRFMKHFKYIINGLSNIK